MRSANPRIRFLLHFAQLSINSSTICIVYITSTQILNVLIARGTSPKHGVGIKGKRASHYEFKPPCAADSPCLWICSGERYLTLVQTLPGRGRCHSFASVPCKMSHTEPPAASTVLLINSEAERCSFSQAHCCCERTDGAGCSTSEGRPDPPQDPPHWATTTHSSLACPHTQTHKYVWIQRKQQLHQKKTAKSDDVKSRLPLSVQTFYKLGQQRNQIFTRF